MRTDRGRTKKLIVAFHFHTGNQAGWKCDQCREAGLERRRRCGWIAESCKSNPRTIWVGGGTAIQSCPQSYITGQSITWIEEYLVWRTLGGAPAPDLDARTVEAFLILSEQTGKANGR